MEDVNLYDYPREHIERRKLLRKMRRTDLLNDFAIPETSSDIESLNASRAELYANILALDSNYGDDIIRMQGIASIDISVADSEYDNAGEVIN